MASVRLQLLDQLVARLSGIAGWNVRLRGIENDGSTAQVQAVVYPVSESKALANNELYGCELQVGVLLYARNEDADPTVDLGEPYRYLDRLVATVEARLHAPDAWQPAPLFLDCVINGHDVDNVDGDPTQLMAFVRLTFTYRHLISDPEVAA